MKDEAELSPGWRLILAFGVVFGIVGVGFATIYLWYLLIPLALAGVFLLMVARWVLQK